MGARSVGLHLHTSCRWTPRRCGFQCSPHRTCEDRPATWGSCSFPDRSYTRETRHVSPEQASCPRTTPSWTGVAVALVDPSRLDLDVRRPSVHSREKNNYYVYVLTPSTMMCYSAFVAYFSLRCLIDSVTQCSALDAHVPYKSKMLSAITLD